MSGLMPYEASGESSLLTPLEPSTTVVSYYESHPITTVASSYPGSSSYKAAITDYDTPGVTTTVSTTTYKLTYTTVGITRDHPSTISKSIPFLLPLWAWAALLLGIVVLLSVTTIWITLVVGWKKNKRSRRKRRDNDVNLNTRSLRSSRRNSNLWIDENDGQGESVEGACTPHTPAATRLPAGTSNVGVGYPNASATYAKQHNDILKEMKAKSSLFLNEQARDRGSRNIQALERHGDSGVHTIGDHCDHERYGQRSRDTRAAGGHKSHQDSRPHTSQTLPRSMRVNPNLMTDARLSHRLIHLQPATTSTFKRRAAQKHTQNINDNINEHIDNTTHSDTHQLQDRCMYYAGGGTQAVDTAMANSDMVEREVDTAMANSDTLEMKVNICDESRGFDMNLAYYASTHAGPSVGDAELHDIATSCKSIRKSFFLQMREACILLHILTIIIQASVAIAF